MLWTAVLGCANDRQSRRFGGWTELKFDATGFFRIEHDGRRWWLVTPEGHAFISWGVNHYHAGWWAQDYNLDHWLQRFGAEKVSDAAWTQGFREVALADLRRLGLNTLGIHTNATMLTHPPGQAWFPFVAPFEPLVLSHYLKPQPDAYADIFAPEFEAQCERTAQRVAAPYRDDPMVLGYCMADCPPLTDNEADWNGSTTWPRRLRNFAAEAPGKQAYVDCMRERYGDVFGFNATYGTRFAAWSDLLKARDWRPDQAPIVRRNAMTTRPSCCSVSTATTPWPRRPSAAPTRTTFSSATRSTATRT